MKTIKYILPLLALFLVFGKVDAAVVGWSAPVTNVSVNDTFSLDIVGSGFGTNIDGGGVSISFDPGVLNVVSVSIDETVWDLGAGIQTGDIDNLLGAVDNITVNAWSAVFDNFTVATITFQAVGSGSSLLSLTGSNMNPWASAGLSLTPEYMSAEVNVNAVPIPGALWLFVFGLLGLFGFVRDRNKI